MNVARAVLQPRYRRELSASAEDVLQTLRTHFAHDHGHVRMTFRGAHAQVSIAPENARWWSPWLTIEVLRANTDAVVDGRFGSNPAFFTMWAFALGASLLVTLGLTLFGLVQWQLGESLTILTFAGVAGVCSFALAALPLVGQERARGQMQHINDALEACYAKAQGHGHGHDHR